MVRSGRDRAAGARKRVITLPNKQMSNLKCYCLNVLLAFACAMLILSAIDSSTQDGVKQSQHQTVRLRRRAGVAALAG